MINEPVLRFMLKRVNSGPTPEDEKAFLKLKKWQMALTIAEWLSEDGPLLYAPPAGSLTSKVVLPDSRYSLR